MTQFDRPVFHKIFAWFYYPIEVFPLELLLPWLRNRIGRERTMLKEGDCNFNSDIVYLKILFNKSKGWAISARSTSWRRHSSNVPTRRGDRRRLGELQFKLKWIRIMVSDVRCSVPVLQRAQGDEDSQRGGQALEVVLSIAYFS
jgi:hypothetical protein